MALEAAVARRYARALAELSEELDVASPVAADMERLGVLIADPGSDLVATLSNPVFTIAERQVALAAVLDMLELHDLLCSFLKLLLSKNRFAWLPQVVQAFQERADQQAGRVRATVTTARALSPQLVQEIQASLAKATGREVVITSVEDPSLLAGLVVELGGTVYDASLRSRLDELEQALTSSHSSETPEA
jgi:F-type H+-transporting ATPase subunit delta